MTEPTVTRRVWATRPEAQNLSWITTLQAQGFDVVNIPLLSIEPVQEVEAVQAVKNLILDFDQFQKVVFVSQNAVQEAFTWLEDYWPQLPAGIEYFAIGKKTAQAVSQHNVDVVSGGIAMNSDELLNLPQLLDVWGQRVLIFRGQGGLPKLGEVLHERGAMVRYCELYLRLPPQGALAEVNRVAEEPTANEDIVPLFSGETLENLNNLLNNHQDQMKLRLTLVVPGKRVAHLAESFGFPRVYIAANASAEEMLNSIVSVCAGTV